MASDGNFDPRLGEFILDAGSAPAGSVMGIVELGPVINRIVEALWVEKFM